MLKYLKVISLSLLVISIASCSKTKTYADYLEEERKSISRYIDASNIRVQNSKPEETAEWKTDDGRDIYYRSSSGLYYHQIEQGDGAIAPMVRNKVYVRYVGKTLSGNVIYDCTPKVSPNPESFEISPNPRGKRFGTGFQEAVKYMREGGRCKIIVPFNLGNGTNWTLSGTLFSDSDNYTPMVYEIWLLRVD
jgi:FKBP-type peptidyl-prolyl cis-trans isomerase